MVPYVTMVFWPFLENYYSVYYDQGIMNCYSQVAVLICPGIEINFQMLLGLKKL